MTQLLHEEETYLFHQGTHYESYRLLGVHKVTLDQKEGFRFAVWAPHANYVSVVGDFNNWDSGDAPLTKVTDNGLWAGFFTTIKPGSVYKYHLSHPNGTTRLKADPYARYAEVRPNTGSVVWDDPGYTWNDQGWFKAKEKRSSYESPVNIYEVHLGTWQKKPGEFAFEDEDEALFSYRELAETLIPYVKKLGYTHIELMPITEHPFDLSWGYQITGYYAVTSRYGRPEDFKYFVDQCHQNNIGVILDWVPGHFCRDDHGLRQFDGEPLFEYADHRKADKPSWGTLTFDFGRPEIQSFLISNAVFWLKEFHLDGIRVDAVASMIYLNFDLPDDGPKMINSYGGEENLESIAFLKKMNEVVFSYDDTVLMMAEDSTDIPLVTSPTYVGGLGFNYKWNMGWMNDTLKYFELDPIHRKYNHHLLTFSFMYTFSENFVLPLSHDEVVHGKKSILDKNPGDQWQKFAGMRALIGYQMMHPGKKLLFMGSELGMYAEWKDKEDLDWHLLDYPLHQSMQHYIRDINHLYKDTTALYENDHDSSGFQFIDADNNDQSILCFIRRGKTPGDEAVVVCNFTPVVHYDYKVGVPQPGVYQEVFNSDQETYGGSGQVNPYDHHTFDESWHGQEQHMKIMVPPMAVAVFSHKDLLQPEGESQ
ncbi:1,4-alpha-glucan branching protein GlgB [Salisediminibacterium halotolerans]|uniref:1,4-alpha-glucan branching protein GlgB n=1 Tax=Salisediminibacterium halotolerans TaxID=517425 RepID=UPI000EB0C474|nr:1,4-alpha-glucan branching protein GlgB [Salisediminibacterium halotolerans]RLJ69409.1 1,4-alpha-glucan branching enzyme [Actinophytocola xinjiangensis]RPE83965.1 1,4-alpha-glucan branching enzyme [Salisediminibacterium halotolerans]TWG32484.1 1,4-alpha-glucan branching enzyme [Salisediminibacterium halotolerans]GEL07675.1 1,4-alpha-glucan branching enzyme GlgB [Salisediminibacterium halotolerans]